ncbi:hypothetical protein GOP47_0025031 [Adiantum capillus-veneris]|uniref:Pentatricopeptide repeat-containing protein n=1 Tax=Adiantum capillus-veneris TaxID=13818 RepID=A0A9D4Z5L1_ADICA|nr:hypothetical protein GOP47_0025031 [Adiantum capillus-veneris]
MCQGVSICTGKGHYEGALSAMYSHAGETFQGLLSLCKQGLVQEALQALDSLGKQGVHIPQAAAVFLLQNCARENHLLVARQLHATFLKYETHLSSKLSCQFIHVFASCGTLGEALNLFHNMAEKTAYAWTAIISVHAKGGKPEQALMLYDQMKALAVRTTSHTTVAALKACICLMALQEGMVIHSDALKEDLEADLFVGSALVDMYAKCGSLQEAHDVFEKLGERDVVTWCAMIAGFMQQGCGVDALKLHEKMRKEGTEPNLITLVSLLKACATIDAVSEGELVHTQIVERGFEGDMFTANTVIDMYVQFQRINDARKVFDMMPKKDAVSWNAMITGYVDQADAEESILLFKKMEQDQGQSNEITFLSILKACALAGNLKEGELVHTELTCKGMDVDYCVGSTLIDMYAKCGKLDAARLLFDKVPKWDVVLWCAIISGYVQHGSEEGGLELYQNMRAEGTKPDKILVLCILKACVNLYLPSLGKQIHADIVLEGLDGDFAIESTLCDMYLKSASYQDAHKVFYGLPIHNVGSFNLLLAGYSDQGHGERAVDVFEKMMECGTQPNEVSFACMLKACSSIAAWDQGAWTHSMIVKKGFDSDLILQNALVDLYAKCQHFGSALYIFERLPVRSVVSWSALIAGYSECGCLHEAGSVLDAMKGHGVAPNEVTLVCVLKACTSQAALKGGILVHIDVTKQGYNFDKHVGNSLIDMYSKCGRPDEACKTFEDLPDKTVITWSTLMAGLVENGNEKKAIHFFHEMEKKGINPNEITYVCVLKACASLAALDHGKRVHEDIDRANMGSELMIANTLIDMYCKCGCLKIAVDMFEKLSMKDVVSWNAIIGGLADHGHQELVHQSFLKMQHEGVKPNGITFVVLLTACSHAGLVPESYYYYDLMISRYSLNSTIEHHACMVDVLGRAGLLSEAEELAGRLSSSPSPAVWAALLGACALSKNLEFGKRAFENLIRADRWNLTGYVLMSNILIANQDS